MKNAIFPPALDVQFYHAACSTKQVMGGVHAHSVDDRQEAVSSWRVRASRRGL